MNKFQGICVQSVLFMVCCQKQDRCVFIWLILVVFPVRRNPGLEVMGEIK